MAETSAASQQRASWRRILKKDAPAGLVNAVVSVPDGLASAARDPATGLAR